MGAIRILDCYRDVPTTFRGLFSMFANPTSWAEMLSGGIFKLGLDVYDFALILIGVMVVCIVSKFQKAEGISLRHKISEKPILACLCICALVLAIAIFGAYGLGFDSSGFIYTQF